MVYAKIDVNLPDDLAIRKAGVAAEHLYIRAILHCKKLLTDGVIHRIYLPEVARGIKGNPEAIAAALVAAGLWEAAEGGWRIPHSKWLKWQDTKAQVEAKQEATRKRIRNWRDKRNGNALPERDCNGVTNETVTRIGNAAIDTEPDIDTEPEPIKKDIYRAFQPPSIELVNAYCEERRNGVDPQAFHDHYTANGWKIGKASVKDWKACVRTWEKTRPKPTDDKPRGRLPTPDEIAAWSPSGGES